jgi:protein-S-isoprenylcysteine O-methyltransferase Ste14
MALIMAKDADHIIIACWIIFLAYWLVSAFRVKAIAEMQNPASAAAHRIPVGLGWFLMAYPKFSPPMNDALTTRTDLTMAIGAAICVFGLFITIWARRTLAGNWSNDVTFKQNHELIKTGPYRFVRHPIYTGLLLMCLGTAVEIGRVRFWLALPLWFIGFWIKLKQEEKLMLRHFPDEYPVYRKQVKALVPFVI